MYIRPQMIKQMKKSILALLVAVLFSVSMVYAQYETETIKDANSKFTYTMVKGDPLKVRTYTLSNGLTVMISVNKKSPRVQTLIATKAGSKNDPAENTGLAHYLEHMLFKGTDKFGSKNWKSEKEQLEIIDELYEKYNKTTDEQKRKTIYHEIDSVSGLASKYAIANEYDKMMTSIGAQGTNAFTSLEQTVYVNDIPQNNIEKWLGIEAERFRNPILRLFHTELEAVYEEKNISLDNDGRKVFEALLSNLFRKHSYGTQTTIGTVEHLKNPSLVKIRNYYNSYYVPNNMAIILAGDIDPEKTMTWIEAKFGYMKTKKVPSFEFLPETTKPVETVVEVNGPDAENMMIGYRLPGIGNLREARLLQIVDAILSNSKAGLIDLNLLKKQEVLAASSSNWINKDYSIEFLTGKPKAGQKLEEVKDLLLAQIENIKSGNFDGNLLKAIISNIKVMKIEERKSNDAIAYTMLDAFTLGRQWKEAAADLDAMATFTKKDVMDFAKMYFTNDRVVIYKRKGEDKSVTKIVKPEITPVDVNRDDVSPFVKAVLDTKTEPIKPVFVDYNKAIKRFGYASKVQVSYLKNEDNDLFKLYYVLDMGKFNDLKLPLAVNYLQFLGTDKYSAEDISKEFYKLACDFGVSVQDEQVYVYLTGLNENFDAAVKLFEHLLTNAKPDEEALKSMVERNLKNRADNKLNKGVIFRRALNSYAMYGKNNPFTYNLSEQQLKAITSAELVSYIKALTSYQHKIWYFGPLEMQGLRKALTTYHLLPAQLKDYPKPVEFTRNNTSENKVFFTNYDMVQAEIMWINRAYDGYDTSKTATVTLLNEYFGGGMSGLVFQTIRESKALAYSTYSYFQQPSKKKDPNYIIAYVGTQSDKMNDAIPAMNELLNKLPRADKNFDNAVSSIKNSIETERINDEEILFRFDALNKLGINHDNRQQIYNRIGTLKFEDIDNFFNMYYVNKPSYYCIMGSKDKLKQDDLKKYGNLVELSLEDIFGY